MQEESLIPVILCGGLGSRLWPLSRKSFPKQFLSLLSDNKKSLLQKTQERIIKNKNIKNPILICNEEHRFIVAEQMREIKVEPLSILLEPFARNTCPAITLAALVALNKGEDPNLLILSSDHIIHDEDKFLEVLNIGINYSNKNKLVTFGVVPTSAETGYGYIKAEKPFDKENLEGSQILKFFEKPNIAKAQEFLKDKRFTWNSGIFMFKASTIISEIKKFQPEILTYCELSLKKSKYDLDFERINSKSFEKCPNISIDIAVMERTNLGIVLPLDAGWSDIGCWKSVWENSKKDNNNNASIGNVIIKETKNSYLRSENRLLVSLGIEDLIIVDTSDAILVAKKDKNQEVKNIVQELHKRNIPQGYSHKKIFRPWGHYFTLADNSKWQVKLINVKPNECLSLQLHHFRSEHWVVVSGVAKVEIDDKEFILKENQSTYISQGSKHRLSNHGQEVLQIIEIQSGSYLGEDDIERFEDNYGRTT